MPGWCFSVWIGCSCLFVGFGKSLTQAVVAGLLGSNRFREAQASCQEFREAGGPWLARLAGRCSRPLAASAGSRWFPARGRLDGRVRFLCCNAVESEQGFHFCRRVWAVSLARGEGKSDSFYLQCTGRSNGLGKWSNGEKLVSPGAAFLCNLQR